MKSGSSPHQEGMCVVSTPVRYSMYVTSYKLFAAIKFDFDPEIAFKLRTQCRIQVASSRKVISTCQRVDRFHSLRSGASKTRHPTIRIAHLSRSARIIAFACCLDSDRASTQGFCSDEARPESYQKHTDSRRPLCESVGNSENQRVQRCQCVNSKTWTLRSRSVRREDQ